MKPMTWRYIPLLLAVLAALSLVSCRDRDDREPTPITITTTPAPTVTWPPTLAPFASPLESPPGSQP